MLTIISGVFCVSFKQTTNSNAVQSDFLFISVFFGLLTGLLYAVHLFIGKYCQGVLKFTAAKLTIDGMMVSGLMFAIGFFFVNESFQAIDIIEGSIVCFAMAGGGISLTTASITGKGGPIQAIDSLKSLIPLFLNIILKAMFPTLL